MPHGSSRIAKLVALALFLALPLLQDRTLCRAGEDHRALEEELAGCCAADAREEASPGHGGRPSGISDSAPDDCHRSEGCTDVSVRERLLPGTTRILAPPAPLAVLPAGVEPPGSAPGIPPSSRPSGPRPDIPTLTGNYRI